MIKWALLKRCDFARLMLLYRTDKVHFLLPFRVANFLTNQTVGKMILLISKYS